MPTSLAGAFCRNRPAHQHDQPRPLEGFIDPFHVELAADETRDLRSKIRAGSRLHVIGSVHSESRAVATVGLPAQDCRLDGPQLLGRRSDHEANSRRIALA
jgi:hypothetical protein